MKKPIPFGKYLLLERINVGGMAEVFLGKAYGAEGFERLLAIKKILPTMVEDEEFITMFLDEARISVQLNHPNVVQIHELGRQDDNFYIAMDYVAGKDLRTILERYRRRSEVMPTAQAAYLAQRMAEGLDYAHRKKDARGMELHIVHRDVSPQNILVSYAGEVKIIDFGIAKAANRAQKTQAGILKGKFGYMSPEQVRGLPIDRRSDIFALGVVFFEMLTGEKLFAGESDFSTLEKVRNAEVPSPRQFNASIPPALEKVVYKALAREVEDRYQWAGELAEDLKRILGPNGYGEAQLGGFMADAFREDVMREEARQKAFAEIAPPGAPPADPEGRNHSSSSRPAARPAPSPPTENASPRPSLARPVSAAPRKSSAAPVLDPVSAALAELDGSSTLQPGTTAAVSSGKRPAPRMSTPLPPRPAEPPPESASTDYGDPNHPDIPPPTEEELAEMGTADRTVLHHPGFADAPPEPVPAAPAPAPRKTGLGLQSVAARAAAPVPPERETFDDEKPAPPPRKSRVDVRPPAPALAPELTRARDPEPDAEDLTGDLGSAGADEQLDEAPPPRMAPRGAGRARTFDDDPEPTASAPNRRRRGTPAPEPEPEAYEEPEPDPDADPDAELHDEDHDPHGDEEFAEPPAAVPAARSKLPLMVGGALGVLICAGLAFAVYTLASPAPSSITVTVQPPSPQARALIDGHQVMMGVEVPVSPGEHEVSLSRPGQAPQVQQLSVSKGQARKLQFELEREDDKPAAAEPKPESPKPQPSAEAPKPEATPKPEAPKPEATKSEPTKPEAVAVAPQPAPTPASKTFSLRVDTEPPGAVVLFGKQKSPAPFTTDGLERSKSYTVEARLRGYTSPTVKVKFDGEDPMHVTVKLEPEAAKPERAERAEKPEKSRPTKAAKGSGTLICSSNPPATVFVDGKSTKRFTPIGKGSPIKLSAGHHVIRFEANGLSAEKDVTIEPDGEARIVGITLQ